jgi:putative FmdB family regulatory protein
MPIYEYKCEGCGDVFEIIQKFSDAPLTVHDKCGAPVHRLVSASALQFKGSGWYITDYAKSNGGTKGEKSDKSDKSEKSDSKAASDSSTKSEAKTDSKPSSPATSTKTD